MRLATRWLSCVLLVLVLLLIFILHPESPGLAYVDLNSALDTLRPGSRPDAPAAQTTKQATPSGAAPDIAAFWRRWSASMHRACPEGPKIVLGGQASTNGPNDPNAPRTPYRDLVRNSRKEIESMKAKHAAFVKDLRNSKGDEAVYSGRGAVLVGGGEYFGPAIIGLHMLRRTGSKLPVEVFVPDYKEYEREVCEDYLPKLGARCVVLSHLIQGGADLSITHYQLKAVSLLLSSFQEVLLLDSDSIPLLDPMTALFDAEPYLSSGLVVWPDFWAATESPRFWEIAGLSKFPPDLPAYSSEAGQLLINKKTHLAPLLLATYYNVFGQEYYYPLLSQGALGQGDKETFQAAAVALGASYYRVKTPVGAIGRHDGSKHKGTAMVQYLPSDDMQGAEKVRPAFLHSNTPKMNAGHLVDEGDLLAVDGTGRRLRLLGSKEEQESRFGYDVESTIWDLLVQTGCELAGTIREWKTRQKLCERLEDHHKKVFHDA